MEKEDLPNKPTVNLANVSTEALLNELATRKGFVEIEVGKLYGEYDLVHLYHDDPKRHIAADRTFLLNPRYRKGSSHHKAPTFP